jgi:hypothetical protein
VKVTKDSQYALINHAPDVSVIERVFELGIDEFPGGPFMGPEFRSTGAQVHWTASRAPCHSKLLWRD